MLYYALVFLIVGLVAGILGLSGIAVIAGQISWILFVVGLVLLVVHLVRGRSPPDDLNFTPVGPATSGLPEVAGSFSLYASASIRIFASEGDLVWLGKAIARTPPALQSMSSKRCASATGSSRRPSPTDHATSSWATWDSTAVAR